MRRLVVIISLVMLLETAGFSAVIPLLPHYRDTFDLSPFGAGVLLAAYSAAVLLFAVPAGQLSDLFGSKWMTIAGTACLTLSLFLMAIAGSFGVLLLARVLQGSSDAVLWTAGIAWVSSTAPLESRGTRIGVVQAAGAAGFIAGPVLGTIAVSGAGVATTFTVLAAISLVLLAFVVTIPEPARPMVEHKPSLIPMLAACSRQSLITASAIIIFVAAIVGGALQLLITLQLSDGGMSASRIGAIYTAGAVLAAAVAVLTGRGGDRYGRVPVAVVGTAVLAASVAALALPIPERGFVALTIFTFGLEAVLYATAYPLSVDGADRSQIGHGVVLGVVNLAWGIGAVVGPLGGSVLGTLTGSSATYVLIGVFTAASCLYIRSTTTAGPPATAHR